MLSASHLGQTDWRKRVFVDPSPNSGLKVGSLTLALTFGLLLHLSKGFWEWNMYILYVCCK